MNDNQSFTEHADASPASNRSEAGAWKILIADDDAAVHQVTKMVMAGFQFDDKPVQFISAFSGKEACQVMDQHPDIALVLLDVVMEDDQAGLDVARYIRETLGNHSVRIVMRTGQPGQAPEEDVVRRYDINDYKDKTELTKTKLVTLFFSALRSYRDISSAPTETPSGHTVSFIQNPDALPSDILISGMAHEIGTPLGVCVSSLSYLQELLDGLFEASENGHLSPEQLKTELASSREAAQLTWKNLQRSVALVKSFKAIATDKSTALVSHFNLDALLQDLVRSLQPEIRKKVPRVEVSCPEKMSVSSDAGALTQILSNLILNSLKHGFSQAESVEENCIEITVMLSTQPESEECSLANTRMIELLYQDSGIGIPPEHRSKIFEAFFTTQAAEGGTGIGLSVARELAQKRLSGKLELLDSDSGVCFRLVFPQDIATQSV